MNITLPRYLRRTGIFAILLLAGCLESYDPPGGPGAFDNLVVDAILNSEDHSAIVRLSRPRPIYEKENNTAWVGGASVSIASPSGETVLNETTPGRYTKTAVPVTVGEAYTLHVTTSDGREYYSDPVEILPTPPIDKLNLALSNDGNDAEITLDSRDPSGKAKYYSWDYVETYEYTATYFSGYSVVDGLPVIRRPDQLIYRCWRTIPSSSIGIVTTRDLTASVINQLPIITIPAGSIKLSTRYSVLVSQRVIGESEYNYLRQLKNTTENLGGLFDPQPGTVLGNIHEKDRTDVRVLGYFSAGQIISKRFFISYEELPEVLKIPQSSFGCTPEYSCSFGDPQPLNCLKIDEIGANSHVLTAEFDSRGNPLRVTYVKDDCSDCRVHGGVTTRPDFWPPPN